MVYLRVIKCLGGKFGVEKKVQVLNLRENKCPDGTIEVPIRRNVR